MSLPSFLFSSPVPSTPRSSFAGPAATTAAPAAGGTNGTGATAGQDFRQAFAQAAQGRASSTQTSQNSPDDTTLAVSRRSPLSEGDLSSDDLQAYLQSLIKDLQEFAEEGDVSDESAWAELLQQADLSVEQIDWLAANLQAALDELSATGQVMDASAALRDFVGLLTGGKALPADATVDVANLADTAPMPDADSPAYGGKLTASGASAHSTTVAGAILQGQMAINAGESAMKSAAKPESLLIPETATNPGSVAKQESLMSGGSVLKQEGVLQPSVLPDVSKPSTNTDMALKPDTFISSLSAILPAGNPAEELTGQSAINPIYAKAAAASGLQAPADAQLHAAMKVQVAFGHAQWSSALAERAAWLASQQIHSAELQLDPPELGPLQVRISVHQDQAVVSFVSANPQVREALDQSMMRLRELLQEQGMQLVDAGVSDQGRDESRQAHDAGGPERLIGDSANDLENDQAVQEVVDTRYGVDDFA